jgi:hypothetical protein
VGPRAGLNAVARKKILPIHLILIASKPLQMKPFQNIWVGFSQFLIISTFFRVDFSLEK